MKKIRIYAVTLAVSILLSSGCSFGGNTTSDITDNSKSEEPTIVLSDNDLSNQYCNSSAFMEDDDFYIKKAMKCIDDKLYVSGYVIDDNGDTPNLVSRYLQSNTEYMYSLDKEEKFYYSDDVIYTFKINNNQISTVNLLDSKMNLLMSKNMEKYNIRDIETVLVNGDTVYVFDKEMILHKFEDGFDNCTETDVSEYLLRAYRIITDKQNNIYIFTSDAEETVLFKLDAELHLDYKSDDYSDMPGDVYDIFIENEMLYVQTIADGQVYTNIIDKNSGKTLSREVAFEYNDTNNEGKLNLDENETYIGTCSDESFIVLRYPEIQEYYCVLVKDENENTIEQKKFIIEQSPIISKVEICNNGDTLYIEESYDVKTAFNESDEAEEHIIHRIKSDGTHSSFRVPVYNNERYPLALKSDNIGNVYIIENKESRYQICCYDEYGNLKYDMEDSNKMLSYINSEIVNDELYVNYISYDEKYIVQKINSEGGWGAYNENLVFKRIYSGNNQYDLFTTDGKKVFGYNIDKCELTEILSLINCGIQFTPSDFFGYNKNYVISDDHSYYLLSKDDASKSKQVIKMSGIDISQALKNQVVNFNSKDDEYIIECVDYNFDEDSVNNLNMDIVTKKTDLVVFNNYSPIKAENYNSFVFADLSNYLNENSEINDDCYFYGVINLYRSDAKLYTMITEFNIYTMIKRAGEDVSSIKLNDFLNDVSQMNEHRFGLASNLFSAYIKNNDFVNNDFRSILKFLKENVHDISDGNRINFGYVEITKENNNAYRGCVMTPYFFQKNADISYCGFPTNQGKGIVVEPLESISILDNSENKDGAWRFIEYCLSDEYQNSLYRGIPVKKSAYDKVFTGGSKEKERCLNVINSADCKYIGDTDLFNIIWEESEQYFNDERSLDETVKSIKNKTNIYLSETTPSLF